MSVGEIWRLISFQAALGYLFLCMHTIVFETVALCACMPLKYCDHLKTKKEILIPPYVHVC